MAPQYLTAMSYSNISQAMQLYLLDLSLAVFFLNTIFPQYRTFRAHLREKYRKNCKNKNKASCMRMKKKNAKKKIE